MLLTRNSNSTIPTQNFAATIIGLLVTPIIIYQTFGALSASLPLAGVILACLMVQSYFYLLGSSGISIKTTAFSLLWFVLAVSVIQFIIPAVNGPDGHRYYYMATNFSIAELFSDLHNRLTSNNAGYSYFIWSFPILVNAFQGQLIAKSPDFIALFNGTFVFVSALLWVRIIRNNYANYSFFSTRHINFVFLIFVCTSSIIYWSAVFNKDIVALSLTVFSCYCLYFRRYSLTLIIAITAFFIRPYSIIIAIIYLISIQHSNKIAYGSAVGAVGISFVASGLNLAVLYNIPVLCVYLFLSPNPFDAANWVWLKDGDSAVLMPAMLTVEGLFFGVALGLGVYYMLTKQDLKGVLFRLFCGIIISASMFSLLGSVRSLALGVDYEGFMLGADIVRKKLNMYPVIFVWTSICYIYFINGLFSGLSRRMLK